MTDCQVIPIKLDTHREKFNLFLGGDWHYGHPDCDMESIYRFIDEVQESVNRGMKTHVALMGDYSNCFSKADIRRDPKNLKNIDPLKVYTRIRDIIKPIVPVVDTVIVGNHDYDWWKNEHIDFVNWMCAELKIRYGTYESYIRYKVQREGEGSGRRNVDVALWHGGGSSRTRGGAFNAAAKPMSVFKEVNIVGVGHFHRLGMLHEQSLKLNEVNLDFDVDDQYIVMTGGYLKGYVPHDPSKSTYISRKMLPPVAIGGVKLVVQPFKKVGDTDMLDVTFMEVR